MAGRISRYEADEADVNRVESIKAAEEGLLLKEAKPYVILGGGRGLGAKYSDDPPTIRPYDVPAAEEVAGLYEVAWQDEEEEDWQDDLAERREGWGDGPDEMWIKVRFDRDDVERMPVKRSWTILDVKCAIYYSPSYMPNIGSMVLTLETPGGEILLRNDKTLANYDIQDGDELSYTIREGRSPDYMRLVIFREGVLPHMIIVLVTVMPFDSVRIVKEKIEKLAADHDKKIEAGSHVLLINGVKPESDDITMRSLDVITDSVLSLRSRV